MILSGLAIKEAINNKEIEISPFKIDNLGPNSYNLTLSDSLMVYSNNIDVLDMKEDNKTHFFTLDPTKGFVLEPGELYLGSTVEYTATDKYVPMIEGRSSIGRLGVSIHITAGFGDIGFKGHWVLEISVIRPVRIYPFVPIAQVFFHNISPNYELYKGKYQNQPNYPVSSQIYKDITKK